MEFLVSKLLSLWLYPLGLAIAVLVLVTLVQLLMGRGKSGFLLLLVTAGLWLSSTPWVANWMVLGLERDAPAQTLEATESADAIVMLGGAVAPPLTNDGYPNLQEGADRLLHTLRLYKAGKAPKVVITGGQLPWRDAPRTEAEVVAELLIGWGVPTEMILLEKASTNTYENALYTKTLLEEHGIGRVLLVTSAFHMRRALAVFHRAGINALPAATDHLGAPDREPTLLDWMPDAWSLYVTSLAVKEHIGMAWYRWKEWV